MTSIHPRGAVKPRSRSPGLAEFKKPGQRESFRVPQGFGNGRIKLPEDRLDALRKSQERWGAAKHVTISPSCSRIVSHLSICDLAGLALRPLGMKRRNS